MADMKPGETSSATAAGGAARADLRNRAAGQPASAPTPTAAGAPRDSATVLGIPETELTPRVQAAVTSLMGELQSLRRQLERMQERVVDLERLADRDTLTPLVNRRAFLRELDRTIAQAERHGTRASLLYIDLDGLKAINDRFGHAAGDEAILHFGDVINEQVRRTDLVGRLGGDEFAVLLVQTDPEQAAHKAETIAAALERRPLVIERQPIALGFSYGVQPLLPGQTAGEVMEAADRAMYLQKQAKRSPVRA